MIQGTGNIRLQLRQKYLDNDLAENGTIEIIGAHFIADRDYLIREPNKEYIEKELKWYKTMRRNIYAMKGDIPTIWRNVANEKGEIQSNYGWCVLSPDNYSQLERALLNLIEDKYSRQACMIYTRPSIFADNIIKGIKDVICTFATQLFIRKNKLHYMVNMRSNDAVFGYNNDYAWHDFVFDVALKKLQERKYNDLEKGDMIWNTNSLHVYPRHFKYLEELKND